MYVSSFGLRARHKEGIRATFISADTCMGSYDSVTAVVLALIRTFYSDEMPPPDPVHSSPHPPERDQLSNAADVYNSNLFAWCVYVLDGHMIFDSETTATATDRLMQFVQCLVDVASKNNLRWIFIVERDHHMYESVKGKGKALFTIVTKMHQMFKNGTFLVVAPGDNKYDDEHNGIRRAWLDGCKIETHCSTVFTKSQIVRLLQLLNYGKKFEYSLEVVADSILQCSSGTPLEVYMYCEKAKEISVRGKRHGCNSEEDMARYIARAETLIITDTLRFIATKKGNGLESYCELFVDIIAEAPCTLISYLENFDRRFVKYIEVDSSSGHLQAANQTVLRVFQNIVRDVGWWYSDDWYAKFFSKLAGVQCPISSVYYCIAKLYVTRLLLWRGKHTFVLKYYTDQDVQMNGEKIAFKNLQLFHFKGSSRLRVPEYEFKGGSASALYVPDDNQYPGASVLIYIPGGGEERSKLWAVQLNGALKPSEHMKRDTDYFTPEELPCNVECSDTSSGSRSRAVKDLHRQWASYFGIDVNDVNIVWFVKNMPDTCNEQKRLFALWNEENNMKDFFPLLDILPNMDKKKY